MHWKYVSCKEILVIDRIDKQICLEYSKYRV